MGLDTTKKGVRTFCEFCKKHKNHATEPDKKEKLVWLICECGNIELINNWT